MQSSPAIEPLGSERSVGALNIGHRMQRFQRFQRLGLIVSAGGLVFLAAGYWGASIHTGIAGLGLLALGCGAAGVVNLRMHMDIVERQTSALHSALALTRVPLRAPVFFMGHAAVPDLIEVVAEVMRRRRIRRILELGSGTSTHYLAALLPSDGCLVSVEQDPDWADMMRAEVSAYGGHVQVIHAPITVQGERRFYDTAALAGHGYFDLLLVDGPGNALMRHDALPMLAGKWVNEQTVIVMDDGDFPFIRRTVDSWRREFGLNSVYYQTVRGTWVLWRGQWKGVCLP